MAGRPPGFFLPYRPTTPYTEPRMNGMVRLIISIDRETYDEIDALARQSNCRVGRMGATLIEVGLAEFEKEASA